MEENIKTGTDHQQPEQEHDAPTPPAGDAPTHDETQARFEENRKKFRAAFIHNHGWEEKDGKLPNEQEAEIEAHPFWTDPTKLEAAVNPPVPEHE